MWFTPTGILFLFRYLVIFIKFLLYNHHSQYHYKDIRFNVYLYIFSILLFISILLNLFLMVGISNIYDKVKYMESNCNCPSIERRR